MLVCNFPKPGAEPALMEHADVETFFHEFGHLLHHVLGGHTHWAGIAGVATEWDFVEAPSQMLEEWVWTPETLQTFATALPDRRADSGGAREARCGAADEFGKGLCVRQQMFYAAISLELHTRDPKTARHDRDRRRAAGEVHAVQVRRGHALRRSRSATSTATRRSTTPTCGRWSSRRTCSPCSATTACSTRDAAVRYRTRVLEPGGSQPAAELVKNFLDRPYSFKAFEDWLNAN